MKYVATLLLLAHALFAMCQENTNELTVPALVFDSEGDLIISPSSTSSKADFDFFIGKWKLHNKTLKKKPDNAIEWNEFESTQEMYTILNGTGNIDNYISERNGKYFEGMTLRLFNPQTKLWSIYWADSNYGTLGLPPVVGSFENKVGHFFSKDIYDGKALFTVYRWDARDPNTPVWSQATSSDNGRTWEWNWFMYMRR
jgi:hypothetical protein